MTNSLDKVGMGDTEEEEALLEGEKPASIAHDRVRRGTIKIVAVTVVITIATMAVLSLLYNKFHDAFLAPSAIPPPAPTETPWEYPDCGRTSEEARANGCKFEPMMRGWIPAECYTPEPSDEYSPWTDRKWYYDYNLTKPMELEVLNSGDDVTAYTKTFHDEHCLYAWRKLALAVENRLPLVDTKTMNLHHSTHCALQIAKFIRDVHNHVWVDNHTATAPMQFESCVPLFMDS